MKGTWLLWAYDDSKIDLQRAEVCHLSGAPCSRVILPPNVALEENNKTVKNTPPILAKILVDG